MTSFSLSWSDYKTSLVSAFESIRSNEDFVDVTLGCEGRKLLAHKMLLSACSPYFRDLLRGNPCQHPIIIVRETKFLDLEAILNFIYNGEVNIEEDRLESFLKAAEALQIRGLTEDPSTTSLKRGWTKSQEVVSRKRTVSASSPSTGAENVSSTFVHKRNKAREDSSCVTSEKAKLELTKKEFSYASHPEVEASQEEEYLEEEEEIPYESFGGEGGGEYHDPLVGNYNDEGAFGEPSSKVVCHDCGKSFKSRNSLLDHEHVHKGTTKCQLCGKVCSTRGNLKQHISKVHGR